MKGWNKGNGAAFDLNQHDITVEHSACRTHPRAEQRPMRGCLMLSVMSSMFGRLGLRQSADHQDTKHERGGKNPVECLTHRRRFSKRIEPAPLTETQLIRYNNRRMPTGDADSPAREYYAAGTTPVKQR